jgi:hypothetical protein
MAGAMGGFVAGSIISKLMMDKSGWDKTVKDVAKDEKKLGGMTDRLGKKFDTMGRSMQAAGTKMTVAGAAILSGLGLMISKYVQAGDHADKMAKRTGFATETISELAYAAQIAGADIGALEKGVKRMAKTIVDANDGMATYKRAFDRIGVSVDDLMKMNPEEQFLAIGNAIGALEDPTLRASAAQDIFGRAGTQLLPLFAEGEAGLEALRAKAHELGIVFDEEAAAKAAKLQDAQTTLKESVKGLTFSLAETLVPAVTSLVEKITAVVTKVTEWAKKNPGLTKVIMGVVGALGALLTVGGTFIIMLGTMMRSIGSIITMLPKMKAALGGVSAGLAKVGLVGAAAFVGWKIGRAIGQLKIAGKTIDDHIVGKLEGLTDKLAGVNKEAELGVGAAAALEKRQKMLAEASEVAGREITSIHEALEILGKEVNTTTPAVETFNDELEREKNIIEPLVPMLDAYTASQMSLAKQYAAGDIGMGQYVKRMADLREEREKNLALFDEEEFMIDDAIEGVEGYVEEWESVPGALGSVMQGIGIQVFDLNGDIVDDVETTTEKVDTKWGDMADGLVTKWSEMFGEFILSGDIFKGDFKGLLDGLKTQFTDTLGSMLSEFLNVFIKGLLSGAQDAASGILSSLGAALGGGGGAGGVSSIAGGFSSVSSALSSAVNPIGMISGAVTAIASVASLFKKTGPSSTDSWHFEHIWKNSQEIRDYLFIEQWKMLQNNIYEHQKTHDILRMINRKIRDKQVPYLKSIDSGIGKVASSIKDLAKALSKITPAQHGLVATHPTLTLTGDIPGHVPEVTAPVPAIPAMAQAMGAGPSNNLVFNISAIDARGVREAVRRDIIPEINRALSSNVGKTDLKRNLGIA